MYEFNIGDELFRISYRYSTLVGVTKTKVKKINKETYTLENGDCIYKDNLSVRGNTGPNSPTYLLVTDPRAKELYYELLGKKYTNWVEKMEYEKLNNLDYMKRYLTEKGVL